MRVMLLSAMLDIPFIDQDTIDKLSLAEVAQTTLEVMLERIDVDRRSLFEEALTLFNEVSYCSHLVFVARQGSYIFPLLQGLYHRYGVSFPTYSFISIDRARQRPAYNPAELAVAFAADTPGAKGIVDDTKGRGIAEMIAPSVANAVNMQGSYRFFVLQKEQALVAWDLGESWAKSLSPDVIYNTRFNPYFFQKASGKPSSNSVTTATLETNSQALAVAYKVSQHLYELGLYYAVTES